MTCKTCESSKQQLHFGGYQFHCVQCCTRLVLSTHPDRRQAAVLLAAIERHTGAPNRAQVLEAVKLALLQRQASK